MEKVNINIWFDNVLRVFPGLLMFVVFIFSSCNNNNNDNDDIPHQATPYEIEIPYGFPTRLNIPDDNPMTVEGIELGRYLFYDGRMSGRTHPDSLMSCGTCHIQANNFECGVDHPRFTDGFTFGLNGKPTPHVMLPLINLVWNESWLFMEWFYFRR